MPVTALRPTSRTLDVGESWSVVVELVDVDGTAVATPPAASVTAPDGTAAAVDVDQVAAGVYRAAYRPTVGGRHILTVTGTDDQVSFAAYVLAVTTDAGMPNGDDVAAYIGPTAASYDGDQLAAAVDAEAAAQRAVCDVPAAYPPDLREALLRRAVRNLAVRGIPLAVPGGDAESGPTVVPGSDPEVRRLERPHRRMPIG